MEQYSIFKSNKVSLQFLVIKKHFYKQLTHWSKIHEPNVQIYHLYLLNLAQKRCRKCKGFYIYYNGRGTVTHEKLYRIKSNLYQSLY